MRDIYACVQYMYRGILYRIFYKLLDINAIIL
jgi:hypothetical protein